MSETLAVASRTDFFLGVEEKRSRSLAEQLRAGRAASQGPAGRSCLLLIKCLLVGSKIDSELITLSCALEGTPGQQTALAVGSGVLLHGTAPGCAARLAGMMTSSSASHGSDADAGALQPGSQMRSVSTFNYGPPTPPPPQAACSSFPGGCSHLPLDPKGGVWVHAEFVC